MTRKLDRAQIADLARVVTPAATTEPVSHPPRTFELPTALYGWTVAAYLAFIATVGTAFATRELMIPLAVIAGFIVIGFTVPGLWARMHPASAGRALSWSQFRHRGVQTHTGRIGAKDATIQVLILPALIVCWGFAVAAIVALG